MYNQRIALAHNLLPACNLYTLCSFVRHVYRSQLLPNITQGTAFQICGPFPRVPQHKRIGFQALNPLVTALQVAPLGRLPGVSDAKVLDLFLSPSSCRGNPWAWKWVRNRLL